MGSSGICTNSDAVSSRSGFGDGVCLSVLLYLCCQCVHCVLLLSWDPISTATLRTLIDTNVCKTNDGQAMPKHVADVTSCRIQLSIVLCKEGVIQ